MLAAESLKPGPRPARAVTPRGPWPGGTPGSVSPGWRPPGPPTGPRWRLPQAGAHVAGERRVEVARRVEAEHVVARGRGSGTAPTPRSARRAAPSAPRASLPRDAPRSRAATGNPLA